MCTSAAFLCGLALMASPASVEPVATTAATILAATEIPAGAPMAVAPLVAAGDFSAGLVKATGSIPLHYHADHDEFVVIVSGRGRMVLGQVEYEAKPGAIFFVPRGTLHAFHPVGKEPAGAVSVFGPAFDGKDRIFVDPGGPPSGARGVHGGEPGDG